MTTPTPHPAGFDPTDPDINQASVPHEEFLALRKKAPVFWVEQAPEARAGMFEESARATGR